MSYAPKLSIDGLIFASNDLLIDVRRSYREVVRKTVQIYLEQALGLLPSSEPLITPEEVTLVQKVGNFSSYWDLTKAFVIYFIELLPPVPAPTFPSKFHVPGLIAYLQLSSGNLRISIDSLREKRDIPGLAQSIAAAGGGLDGAHNALPKENRHMLVASGKIAKTNIVGRIFQELYLGAELFERIYNEPAVMVQSTGYAEHEALIINSDILAQLHQQLPLAVVSDRPRSEVERSLRARNIEPFFKSVITLDEIQRAKGDPIPNPWPLLEAARHLRPTPTHTAYIGANLGDVQAAKAANQTVPFTAIGCLHGAHDKNMLRLLFEEHKADMILGHPNHLKELILG